MAAKQKKTPAQQLEEASIRAAFGQVLSTWPHNWSTTRVLEGIGSDDRVVVWEPFENWPDIEVCKQIHDLAFAFRDFAQHAQKKGLV
jgi:hypothetical protein